MQAFAVAHYLNPPGPLDHEQVPIVARRLDDVQGLLEVADLLEPHASLPVAGHRALPSPVAPVRPGRRRGAGRGLASIPAATREQREGDDQEGRNRAPAPPECAHGAYVSGGA